MIKLKVDFAKIGESAVRTLRQNSNTIVGGFLMIGLGLLCKRLDLPVETVTNPYDGYWPLEGRNHSAKLVLIPNNTVESSICAIANGAIQTTSNWSKEEAAEKIMGILRANKEGLSDSTKQFAITSLRYIADSAGSNYSKEAIFNKIAKIGTGGF